MVVTMAAVVVIFVDVEMAVEMTVGTLIVTINLLKLLRIPL
jgi:hypothetical protein